ncbi:hypothetical protein ACLRDC_18220 [Gluconacetobacter sacchari]|uniref:Uncharacterized protein n=1 Tax=Gluconacetobacter sacchari TaxID=92759 RepID=A0A7W4IFV0_9PROT|nr:hypothetical protein [Gluconacetobacter sacchari]MBB2162099.1 hypothetical protein [Gluconacetobacter sacchari]
MKPIIATLRKRLWSSSIPDEFPASTMAIVVSRVPDATPIGMGELPEV